jgi:hypothetical protein
LKNATAIPVGAKINQLRVCSEKDKKSRLPKNSTPNLAGESSHLPMVAAAFSPSTPGSGFGSGRVTLL